MNLYKKVGLVIVVLFSLEGRTQDAVKDLTQNKTPENSVLEKNYKNSINDTVALKNLRALSIQNKNPTVECFALNKLGIFFRDKSAYQKALRYHNEALTIAKNNFLTDQVIISENMLGVIYRRTDEVIPAINHHQKALLIAEKEKNPSETILRNIAISCNSLGNIYLTMNQLDDAFSYFNRSLKIEHQIKNDLGLAINYQNIGGIYEKKNQLDKALENYKKSLSYNEKINSDLGRLICNLSIGGVYLKKNQSETAEKYLTSTISSAEKLQDDFYISSSYINTGWLHFLQNKNTSAKILIQKGLDIAEKQRYISSIIDANKLLSDISEKSGNQLEALKYFKTYSENKEKLINEANLRHINDLNSKYILEKKRNEFIELQNENQRIKLQFTNNKFLFFLLLLAGMLLLASLYYWYRQKMLRKDKAMLIMEQDLLRLQMNPHFIFNALNSIKSYIIKSDQQNAVFYLNNFAKLIRSILSGINQKEVSLKEELSTIETYVSLEKMRFTDPINFEIENKTNLDLEKIKIPSLLLQTFVENSIWHGLSTKEGEKKLKIEIEKPNNNQVLIQILDNGIGREKAKNLKIGNHGKNKSLGLKITEQRLINHYQDNFNLRINDLYQNGKPVGTLVNLKIPT